VARHAVAPLSRAIVSVKTYEVVSQIDFEENTGLRIGRVGNGNFIKSA
jgi:hypothetical protein